MNNPVTTTEFDYVIVGGGTAGSVIARRLADDPDVSVALIEAGESCEHDPKVLLLKESLALVGNPKYDYDYPVAPQQRGNSLLRHARARMLGGCSAHNDCWALRAPDYDMRRWEKLGATGWGPEGTAHYFDRVLGRMGVHAIPRTSELSQAWEAAANAGGFPSHDINTDQFRQGISWVSMNEKDGVRRSTAVSYLFPLSELPPNLHLVLQTKALNILLEGGQATGVRTDRGDITARREVIVCTGAIDTPKLLMLSGIGPAQHLRALGIDVVADLPGVGSRLADHLETPVTWESAREPGESLNGLDLSMYAALDDEIDSFNVQFTIGHFTYWLHTEPFDELERPQLAFTCAPNTARPESEGTVRLASADPDEKPIVDPKYFTDPDNHDEKALVEGIRIARRLAEQPALRPWIVREVSPGPHLQTDAELGEYVRKYSNTVYHPSATCRMGAADDPGAVVDPQLRVRTLQRLRIADASIFPEIVGVNPNMTVVMIGEKAADLIRGL